MNGSLRFMKGKPLFILGDFNEEPTFAQRWSAIRGFGSVCTVNDAMGQPLPTIDGAVTAASTGFGHRIFSWLIECISEMKSSRTTSPCVFLCNTLRTRFGGIRLSKPESFSRHLMCQRTCGRKPLQIVGLRLVCPLRPTQINNGGSSALESADL